MHILKSLSLAAASLAVPAAPVFAQAPAQPVGAAVGMPVKDSAGGEVGTVQSVDGQFVVIRTDRHEVRLPMSSLTPHQGRLLIGMTRADLNAQVDRMLAQSAAAIAPGATVRGSGGVEVATVEAVEGELVTLKLMSGELVRLPKSGVAAGPDGLVIGMTAAELKAAVQQTRG